MAWLGKAWHGKAGRGMARQGGARQGVFLIKQKKDEVKKMKLTDTIKEIELELNGIVAIKGKCKAKEIKK